MNPLYISTTQLLYFWQSIKSLFATKSEVQALQNRITALEQALVTKQDKINTWNDLVN